MVSYTINHQKSSISFSVKNTMLSRVRGVFKSFSASIKCEDLEMLEALHATFSIEVASLCTKNVLRDSVLQSRKLFDVEQYPTITFTTTGSTMIGNHRFIANGIMTLKGKSCPVDFIIQLKGESIDAENRHVYTLECTSILNRLDFQFTCNDLVQFGDFLVDENIQVYIALELYRQTEDE